MCLLSVMQRVYLVSRVASLSESGVFTRGNKKLRLKLRNSGEKLPVDETGLVDGESLPDVLWMEEFFRSNGLIGGPLTPGPHRRIKSPHDQDCFRSVGGSGHGTSGRTGLPPTGRKERRTAGRSRCVGAPPRTGGAGTAVEKGRRGDGTGWRHGGNWQYHRGGTGRIHRECVRR